MVILIVFGKTHSHRHRHTLSVSSYAPTIECINSFTTFPRMAGLTLYGWIDSVTEEAVPLLSQVGLFAAIRDHPIPVPAVWVGGQRFEVTHHALMNTHNSAQRSIYIQV